MIQISHNLFSLLIITFIILIFTACSGLGEKVEKNNIEVYYTQNVSKEEAQKVLNFLLEEFPNNEIKQTSQIDKKDNEYIFKLVVLENFQNNDQYVYSAKTLSYKLSKVFGEKAVHFWACDDGFILQADLGSSHLFTHDKGKILYSNKVTKEEVERLLKGLKEQKIITDVQTNNIELDKKEGIFQLKMSVSPDFREDETLIKPLQELVKKIADTHFPKQAFELHLCNQYLGTEKEIKIVSQ